MNCTAADCAQSSSAQTRDCCATCRQTRLPVPPTLLPPGGDNVQPGTTVNFSDVLDRKSGWNSSWSVLGGDID